MSSISSKLDSILVNKAVNALYKYENKKENETNKKSLKLISDYSKSIIVQVQLMTEVKKSVIKPIRIMIPNTMFSSEEDHSICFFCKTDDKKDIQEYLEKHPITGLSKVLGMNDVKKYYKEIKDKKLLLKSHTHFICDASIAPQLYNVLGSTFSARNNYPVQIKYQKKLSTLQDAILKVVNSTYFHLGGKNISIKFGMLNMAPEEVVQNILVGIPHFISKLQNEWKDVHSIHIKTTDSASLPLYSKVADEMSQYVAEQAKDKVIPPNIKKDKLKDTDESSGKTMKDNHPSSGISKTINLKSNTSTSSKVADKSNNLSTNSKIKTNAAVGSSNSSTVSGISADVVSTKKGKTSAIPLPVTKKQNIKEVVADAPLRRSSARNVKK